MTLDTPGCLELVVSDVAWRLAVAFDVASRAKDGVTGCVLDEVASDALREIIRKQLGSCTGTVIKQGDGACLLAEQLGLSAVAVREGTAAYMESHPELYPGYDVQVELVARTMQQCEQRRHCTSNPHCTR